MTSEELAKEHWNWLELWVQEVPPPEDHAEFVRLMGRMYVDAFVHGYKHGKRDGEE